MLLYVRKVNALVRILGNECWIRNQQVLISELIAGNLISAVHFL